MDRGQQFTAAIVIFIFIAFVIYIFIQNFLLKSVLLLLDFGALLRVLYQIAIPSDRKQAKLDGKTCQTDISNELEIDMDGTIKKGMHPPGETVKGKRKARRSVSVRIENEGSRATTKKGTSK